jgi:hypothetical protein
MKKTEVIKLFSAIRLDHKGFEISDQRAVVWQSVLLNITFEQALKNYAIHLSLSNYEPKPADILRSEPDVNVNHNQMLLDTQTYLEQLAERQQLAIDCPPHLRQTYLKSGGSDA